MRYERPDRFEPQRKSGPDSSPQVVVMHPTASGIRCPCCKRFHSIGLKPEEFWCGCGQEVHVCFAPALYGLFL
ncbi:MAG: hypothetical protein RLZZ342_507 [Candidatus Parcubacteria bacterium]|jgi:hypothetical protein